MKKGTFSTLFTLAISLVSSPVLAEAAAREDNSMTLVYFFLATCGLIIFLQLIPVFAMLYGMLKGVLGHKEEEVKPASVKYR